MFWCDLRFLAIAWRPITTLTSLRAAKRQGEREVERVA
jgi:hypothetical protein